MTRLFPHPVLLRSTPSPWATKLFLLLAFILVLHLFIRLRNLGSMFQPAYETLPLFGGVDGVASPPAMASEGSGVTVTEGVGDTSMATLDHASTTGVNDRTSGGDNEDNDDEIDTKWYPPSHSWPINNLTAVLEGTGVWGFVFNSSDNEEAGGQYGFYNWCNMPHVRGNGYPGVLDDGDGEEMDLVLVEIIHRHHKRTPYASNLFPKVPVGRERMWDCEGPEVFNYGEHLEGRGSWRTYWKPYRSPIKPFTNPEEGGDWGVSCEFPQITREGLDDSWTHGWDLGSVYGVGAMGGGGPVFRVTKNEITSQVGGMLVPGFFSSCSSLSSSSSSSSLNHDNDIYPPPNDTPAPVAVEPTNKDSLEPAYDCPQSIVLFATIRTSPEWTAHLENPTVEALFERLDTISGVYEGDDQWHSDVDHYYDFLSAEECHGWGLPCRRTRPPLTPFDSREDGAGDDDSEDGSGGDRNECVTREEADLVYRLGQHEYSTLYRSHPLSLAASAASMGLWFSEVVAHLKGATVAYDVGAGPGSGVMRYFHNIAHDGSLSRVLSVLQTDAMVWPGMGAEVTFELWKSKNPPPLGSGGGYYLRVLFGGKVLKSSSPSLGMMEKVEVERFIGYVEGLVGVGASKVKEMCGVWG